MARGKDKAKIIAGDPAHQQTSLVSEFEEIKEDYKKAIRTGDMQMRRLIGKGKEPTINPATFDQMEKFRVKLLELTMAHPDLFMMVQPEGRTSLGRPFYPIFKRREKRKRKPKYQPVPAPQPVPIKQVSTTAEKKALDARDKSPYELKRKAFISNKPKLALGRGSITGDTKIPNINKMPPKSYDLPLPPTQKRKIPQFVVDPETVPKIKERVNRAGKPMFFKRKSLFVNSTEQQGKAAADALALNSKNTSDKNPIVSDSKITNVKKKIVRIQPNQTRPTTEEKLSEHPPSELKSSNVGFDDAVSKYLKQDSEALQSSNNFIILNEIPSNIRKHISALKFGKKDHLYAYGWFNPSLASGAKQ